MALLVKTTFTLAVTSAGHAGLHAQTLADVVVSASRAEQRSFDAPAAIQSIDRDTIENAGPQVNLSESLNRVPGLTILNRQNYAQDLQVSIRGFGARSAFGIRGIRLLVDGIPATTPDGQGQGSSISLTSTDRIEVLRGPLAQLYGNSAGGVIQAFTRDAPAQPEFDAQYYTGSFGLRRADWQYAGRVGDYGLVADYSTFDTDGYRDHSKTERKQFNGKLSFDAGEKTHVNVVFNQFDMPLAQDPLGLTAAQVAANPAQAGNNAVSRGVRKVVLQNQLGSSLVHTIDSDRSVTARLYYGTRDNLQYQSLGATGAWVGLARAYYGTGLQYNAQTHISGTPVIWVAGYEFDRSRETRQGGVAALGEKRSTTRNEDNQAENSDLFVQATALMSDKISVVAGLRYSTVRFTSDDNYLSDGDGSGATRYQAGSPVLGLTYHPTDSLNLYANYGKGFESPTLAEVAYSGGGTPGFNSTLNASSSQHYELGAKWAPGPQSRLDFTLFQIDSSDELVVASSNGGNSTFKNAPGTRRTGWELSGSTLLTPHVRATLAASRIDASFSQTFTSGSTTVASGNKIPGIPQSFLFSELLWTGQPMTGSKKDRGLGTQAGLEFTQAGRLYANDTNTASADGYYTVNLKASHGWAVGAGSLTAYARIDNLSDERYVGSVIVNQALSQFYEPAPGRNWTLGMRLVLPL
ncbi:TonB-dependent receptor family protein [Rhodoferax ferrireducens]|uniref:TonB-dependent receptor family protein n=1 Tax=Rhodoferax ferrireducens TaxID=192843 RepID=UPI0018E51B1E|nr:TonB-dependent receptor [Rhodoferax ferrireducens]